jgi:hypothetical protein
VLADRVTVLCADWMGYELTMLNERMKVPGVSDSGTNQGNDTELDVTGNADVMTATAELEDVADIIANVARGTTPITVNDSVHGRSK